MTDDFSLTYCATAAVNSSYSSFCLRSLHLCLGDAFLGLSEFQKAWNNYSRAQALAQSTSDRVLAMHVQASMSAVYTALNDHDSAISCCTTAQQLADEVSRARPAPEVAGAVARFRRRLATVIAHPYRKIGRYNEAMDYCEVRWKNILSCIAGMCMCVYIYI